METSEFKFIYMPKKQCQVLEDKNMKEWLMKWSMKGNLHVQYYGFNEQFHIHKKQTFCENFFKDPNVYTSLMGIPSSQTWLPLGRPASVVNVEVLPCTVMSMDFFDRILLPENNIVRVDKSYLIQCMEEEIDGFLIGDKLRHMLLNKESDCYKLYTESERNQFLFCIFLHMCLGGQWCQYEDHVKPYLDAAKLLYRDLLSVERVSGTNELVVRSVVLKVNALDKDNRSLCPQDQDNIQNFVYLIIDPFKRTVTTFIHQMGGFFV